MKLQHNLIFMWVLMLSISTLGQTVAKPENSLSTIPMALQTVASTTIGDFNNDGNLDYIVGAKKPGYDQADLYLYFGNGSGKIPKYRKVASIPAALQTGISISSGDFNNDGYIDIIATAKRPGYEEAKTYLFINNGKGVFSL